MLGGDCGLHFTESLNSRARNPPASQTNAQLHHINRSFRPGPHSTLSGSKRPNQGCWNPPKFSPSISLIRNWNGSITRMLISKYRGHSRLQMLHKNHRPASSWCALLAGQGPEVQECFPQTSRVVPCFECRDVRGS